MPGGLHPHAHADSSLLQFSVELLSFTIAVIQLPFPALPSFLIHKSDLLKARVIMIMLAPSSRAFGRNATTVYSGRGSRHCYEIKYGNPTQDSVLRRSAHALNPKLPQMMVQMLIHQRRPFHRSQRPEKEVRMLRACPRPTCCKAVNEFAQPLPLHHEVPFIAHH